MDTLFLVVYFQGDGRFLYFQVLCLEESFALSDLFAASFQLTFYLDAPFLVRTELHIMTLIKKKGGGSYL